MKKFLLAALLLCGFCAYAVPVSQQSARQAAACYLRCRGIIKTTDTLTLAATFAATEEADAFYIFNHDGGFVIASADTRCTPVLGHSERGSYRPADAPANLLGWLEDYRASIAAGLRASAPENPATAKAWQELLEGTAVLNDAKSESYLLTSTWSQGYGYNNYCPVWNDEHVVVGCVATAMSQIMRYHRYPARGFGHKQYAHSTYGIQAVDFDTTEYDYDLMPDDVDWYSDDEVIDMVSRFCWHAGITVNMDYQSASHTSGSGSQSSRVPGALTYFGYTVARYMERQDYTDSQWVAMIHEDIDARRPIYYSGSSDDGGHAFVLDGYNSNSEYHFNWGWGGYCDGFYTFSTMQGFTSNNAMVNNIIPSGWDGHLTQFRTSPDGNGGGTSWDGCNSDFEAAVILSQLNSKPIWMKEGTYYGDTAASYAFSITAPVTILGGFAGTEEAANERDAAQHPTLLDGRGSHGVLYAACSSRPNASLYLSDLTIQNGYSLKGSSLYLRSNGVRADNITLRQCTSDSGSAAYIQDCRVRYVKAYGNSAPVIVSDNGAALRQSLIANNDGDALRLSSDARIVACDIVSNSGIGIDYASSRSSVVSSILWNNGSNLQLRATPADTSFRYNAIEGAAAVADSNASDSTMADSLTVRLESDNSAADGPRFALPGIRGSEGWSADNDWQLTAGSPCINAGERPADARADGDLNRSIRLRQGRVDIGCYESNLTAGIASVSIERLAVAPNPAAGATVVRGAQPGSTIQLYDQQGRLRLSQRAEAGETRIDLSGLPNGIYSLRCGESVGKLVIVERL